MFKRTKKVVGNIKTGIARGLGLNILTDMGGYMKDVAKDIITPPKAEKAESFEQALKRLKLTEADLIERRKRFLQQFFAFLTCSILVAIYAIYALIHLQWGTGIVGMLMAVLLCLYAFRAHFWAFQIKHRKLGCTVNEWWNNKIVEENKTLKK